MIESKGAEEFKRLFMSYCNSEEEICNYEVEEKSGFASLEKGYLVNAYIPYGILPLEELDVLIKLFETFKINVVRLTRERNIQLFLPEEIVYDFYLALKELGKNYTGESFKGLITSCIGSKACINAITDPARFATLNTELNYSEEFKNKPLSSQDIGDLMQEFISNYSQKI